jgi:hypothetical protein
VTVPSLVAKNGRLSSMSGSSSSIPVRDVHAVTFAVLVGASPMAC